MTDSINENINQENAEPQQATPDNAVSENVNQEVENCENLKLVKTKPSEGVSQEESPAILNPSSNQNVAPENIKSARTQWINLTGISDPQYIAKLFENWSIENFGTRHKYNPTDGWSTQKGGCYKAVNKVEKITIYIRKFLANCYRWNKESKTKPVNVTKVLVANVYAALKSLKGVYVSRPAPACLSDKNRDLSRIMAFDNTLLDVSVNPPKKIAANDDLYILNRKGYSYDPTADCPKWKEFLGQIFRTKDKDDPTIDILQEIIGLLLIRETKYQKIFAIVGPKRSGKGTILKGVHHLVGQSEVTMTSLTEMSRQFGLQNFPGKSVALIPDASIDSQKANVLRATEILKMISGEDPIEVHIKYEKAMEVEKLPIRFLMGSNTIQSLNDPSGALASRFVFLVTTQSFMHKENMNLINELLEELPGIFNWAIEGLYRLEARGYFLESPRGKIAKSKAEELASNTIAFVRQCCIEKEDAFVERKKLYERYKAWARNTGNRYVGVITFYEELRSVFPGSREVEKRIKLGKDLKGKKLTKRARVFTGIKLNKNWRKDV
mgnify:CR=1 FL=1